MPFTQTMSVKSVQGDGAQALKELIAGWHREQLGTAPGYQRARLLADNDDPGRYVIEVDFSSEEEAQRNDTRSETQAWAESLRSLAAGEPEYHNYTVAYTTG